MLLLCSRIWPQREALRVMRRAAAEIQSTRALSLLLNQVSAHFQLSPRADANPAYVDAVHLRAGLRV